MTKYAKLRRNLIRAGLLAALVFNIQVTRAAYTQLTPPLGWSAGTAATGSEFSMLLNRPLGSGAATISAGRINALASLSINGNVTAVAAKLPIKTSAARVLAGAIFLNPYVRVGVGVASWLMAASIVWNEAQKRWETREDMTGIVFCGAPGYHFENVCAASPQAAWAMMDVGDASFKSCQDVSSQFSCTGETPQGYQSTRYLTYKNLPTKEGQPLDDERQFRDRLSEQQMPESVPREVDAPLPVGAPEIQPLFIPTGNPVPNPNYDPNSEPGPKNQPYNQPGVRVVPAPTTGDPWRVDVQPVDRPTASPNPTGPITDDGGNPGDKPSDDKPGLCDMYPDILACAKPELDTPDGDIPKAQRSVELSDSDLFGGGSCPANVYATVGHQYLQVWNWDQSCYYIVKYLKPVILVLGAFTALMIVSGGTKE